MANNDSSNLSDVDLSLNTSSLGDASNDWNKSVVDTNIGSIDVAGSFSALTQNGIGVGYISSLENALKKSDKLAINISKLIITTAADQEAADNSGAKESSETTYATYAGTRSSGGGGGTYSGTTSGPVSTGSYDEDNKDKDVDIKKEDETETVELTEGDQVNIIKEFQSIFNGELYDYLFETSNATKIKEKLLSSPNISEDLKKKISQMDENEIQVNLKSIYVSGAMVSDFSKVIITIFDNDMKNNLTNETALNSSGSLKSVYSFLAKQSNFQEGLSEIYHGSSKIEKVDDSVIAFTRNFIDTVATASNTTYDDILTNSKYKETLLSEIQDLSNTFSVIEGAKTLGGDTASKLYSSIIIKEEG